MKKTEAAVAVALLTLVFYTLGLSAFASVQTDRTVPNNGTIRAVGVGIYWNADGSNPVSSLDWGLIDPGTSNNITCYIRNEGNSASTLSITTSNWNPSNASQHITMNCDCDGQTLDPNETTPATLTLSVSAAIEGVTTFSFDITIFGNS